MSSSNKLPSRREILGKFAKKLPNICISSIKFIADSLSYVDIQGGSSLRHSGRPQEALLHIAVCSREVERRENNDE